MMREIHRESRLRMLASRTLLAGTVLCGGGAAAQELVAEQGRPLGRHPFRLHARRPD